MRFTVEERHLTDANGRPLTDPNDVSFESCEAESIDAAIRIYIAKDNAEILGDVLKFPGFQAVATIRKSTGVYTAQFTPTSQRFTRS